jgi:hypothetical protein
VGARVKAGPGAPQSEHFGSRPRRQPTETPAARLGLITGSRRKSPARTGQAPTLWKRKLNVGGSHLIGSHRKPGTLGPVLFHDTLPSDFIEETSTKYLCTHSVWASFGFPGVYLTLPYKCDISLSLACFLLGLALDHDLPTSAS